MTQTLKKVSLLLTSFVFIVAAAVINIQPVQAAPQSQNLNGNLTFDPDDNPRLNANPATTVTFGGVGINNGSEGASGQTTADANVNQIYTWRLPNLSDHICSNAQLTSLRIVADVSATVEGTPDLAALMLYRIDGSDTYNVGSYTVQQGVDYAPSTGVITPPGNEGIYGVVRGTDPALGGQLAGQLEATWNLSSFDTTDNFGVMIQQDSEDGTVDLQTTISTLELSYDDENCTFSSDSGTVTDGSSGLTSGLAETGSSSYMYVVSAIAMLITGGGIVVARRFRQTRF